MYCPRCGETQNSGNLRFCNRCGLPMGLVSEVVSNNGTLPQLEELTKNKKWFTRKNGLKFSLVWFLFWFLITMLGATAGGDGQVAAIFVIGFFGGIFMMILSLLFLPEESKNISALEFMQNQQANLSGQPINQNALPPQQTQYVDDFVAPKTGSWKAPDTGDLAQPGSVTEGTTKLLQKEINE